MQRRLEQSASKLQDREQQSHRKRDAANHRMADRWYAAQEAAEEKAVKTQRRREESEKKLLERDAAMQRRREESERRRQEADAYRLETFRDFGKRITEKRKWSEQERANHLMADLWYAGQEGRIQQQQAAVDRLRRTFAERGGHTLDDGDVGGTDVGSNAELDYDMAEHYMMIDRFISMSSGAPGKQLASYIVSRKDTVKAFEDPLAAIDALMTSFDPMKRLHAAEVLESAKAEAQALITV